MIKRKVIRDAPKKNLGQKVKEVFAKDYMLIYLSLIVHRGLNLLKRLTRVWIILFAILAALGFNSPVQLTTSREYQIKAVFLFNFTQFVEWPAEAFSEPDAPMVIGILGHDPFSGYLDETIKGEKIKGHPLIVQRFNTIDEIKICHILFINVVEKVKSKQILESLKGQNILTVGDANNFTQQGGMIGFITENNKIRIWINLEEAKRADIVINSKLLRLAEIVSSSR